MAVLKTTMSYRRRFMAMSGILPVAIESDRIGVNMMGCLLPRLAPHPAVLYFLYLISNQFGASLFFFMIAHQNRGVSMGRE